MNELTALYTANATLLLLHEIESAYEREWEILRLPGKITGFLLMHIPLILVLFFGLVEIDRGSTAGMVLGFVLGIGGVFPLIVHKILVRRQAHFNLPISNIVMYLNALVGGALSTATGFALFY